MGIFFKENSHYVIGVNVLITLKKYLTLIIVINTLLEKEKEALNIVIHKLTMDLCPYLLSLSS